MAELQWKAVVKSKAWEGPSLFMLMQQLEKDLGHPVQIRHDLDSGTIIHAKTGEILGEVRKCGRRSSSKN